MGLHARAANTFTHVASQFDSHIFVERADDALKKANAKSIVFLLALCLNKNDEIIISAEGPDEEDAVNALTDCLQTLTDEEKK